MVRASIVRSVTWIAVALAAVQIGGTSTVRAQETIKLTIIAGHPLASIGVTKLRDVFIPEVDKALAANNKYKIEWTQAYGGTVAKPAAVLEATESGIGDIGYVPTIFEADKLPLEQVSYVTPFASGDVAKLIKVMAELREQIPEMKQDFDRHKLIFLAGIGIDNYHVLAKFPAKTAADLEGKKIATGGLATNWLKGTGAVAISGNLTQYYNGLQTGVYEGIIIFESSIVPYRFHEVAKFISKIGYGAQSASALTINKTRYQRLPKEVQDAILKGAAAYENVVAAEYIAAGERGMKQAAAEGATIVEVSDEERKKMAAKLPNLAKEWAAMLDKQRRPGTKALKTYMELSRKHGFTHMRDWDKE